MRKAKEVLRLKWGQNLSNRAIAASCQIGVATVHDCLRRALVAGLSWPLPDNLTDSDIESRLYPGQQSGPRPLPDFGYIAHELRRPKVTLVLLWEEYRQQHQDGYGRSQFNALYNEYASTLDPRMRMTHKAGEKLFVDYAGMTIAVVDPETGEIRDACVFVATLGASDYTYVEVTWSQSLIDWIGSHVRAFEFFGGVPQIIVPDNLKTGITAACYYEPDVNPTYQEMADYYGIAVIPARVRKPRDKAKVENHVLNVERRILAPLRDRRFVGLADCNHAVWELLTELNNRPFQQMPGSRRELFETLELAELRPLPEQPYSFGQWKTARVNVDYHIAIDRVFYSVPYTFVRKQVDVRSSENVVEIFHKGQRIASHPRCRREGSFLTTPVHMPKAHQAYLEWTPQRLIEWANQTGGATADVVTTIMATRSHPQQGFRSCLGIMGLSKRFGPERLEAACNRAVLIGSLGYRSILSILEKKLDQTPPPAKSLSTPLPTHENIRGAAYYQNTLTLDFEPTKGNTPC
jgi:transposase